MPDVTCSECPQPVPARVGPGRPRVTCSEACRKARTNRRFRDSDRERRRTVRSDPARRAAERETRHSRGIPCSVCGVRQWRPGQEPAEYVCVKCRRSRNASASALLAEHGYGPKYATHIRRRYGLSAPAFVEMLAAQRWRCAICGILPTPPETLVIDHCHTSGAVRELLCQPCNRALGGFRDSVELLRAAADYLLRFAESDRVPWCPVKPDMPRARPEVHADGLTPHL